MISEPCAMPACNVNGAESGFPILTWAARLSRKSDNHLRTEGGSWLLRSLNWRNVGSVGINAVLLHLRSLCITSSWEVGCTSGRVYSYVTSEREVRRCWWCRRTLSIIDWATPSKSVPFGVRSGKWLLFRRHRRKCDHPIIEKRRVGSLVWMKRYYSSPIKRTRKLLRVLSEGVKFIVFVLMDCCFDGVGQASEFGLQTFAALIS